MKEIVSKTIGDFFYTVGEIPVIFLDRHLGIENIENPIEMLEKMNDIIHIGDPHLNWLKTQDLIKYVTEWKHPLQKFNKPITNFFFILFF